MELRKRLEVLNCRNIRPRGARHHGTERATDGDVNTPAVARRMNDRAAGRFPRSFLFMLRAAILLCRSARLADGHSPAFGLLAPDTKPVTRRNGSPHALHEHADHREPDKQELSQSSQHAKSKWYTK